MRIEHVALYVNDLEKTKKIFMEYLGAKSNDDSSNSALITFHASSVAVFSFIKVFLSSEVSSPDEIPVSVEGIISTDSNEFSMLEVFCPSLLEDGNFPQAERENDNIAMVSVS